MKSFSVISGAFGFLVFAACTLDSESPTPEGAEMTRGISQDLRSSCPERPAPSIPTARLAADPELEIDSLDGFTFVDSIYDASGQLIDAERIEMHLDSAEKAEIESRPVRILWNGTDSTGRRVEGGNYFHFYRLLDEAGRVSLVDSACVGYVRGDEN